MAEYLFVGMIRRAWCIREGGAPVSESVRTTPGLRDTAADAVYTGVLQEVAAETVERLPEKVCEDVESAVLTPEKRGDRVSAVRDTLQDHGLYTPPATVNDLSYTRFREGMQHRFAEQVGREVAPFGFSGVDTLSRARESSWFDATDY